MTSWPPRRCGPLEIRRSHSPKPGRPAVAWSWRRLIREHLARERELFAWLIRMRRQIAECEAAEMAAELAAAG